MKLSWDEIARQTGGRLLRRGTHPVVAVGTDSRAVAPGSLFVALRGEHHDGHDYVAQAIEAGAAGALVDAARAGAIEARLERGRGLVAVTDTLYALGELARHHRASWKSTHVVVVTGSNGKTTVKEMTWAALGGPARAARTPGNWNNRIGVPLALLAMDAPALAVVEAGTNEPGEIARLGEIAQPDVAVVTSVAPAHAGPLGGLDAIYAEKTSIFGALGLGGTAIVPVEDQRLVEAARRSGAKVVTFGRAQGAHSRARTFEVSPAGTLVRLDVGGESVALTLPGLGVPVARAAAAALAVATALGRPAGQAAADLLAYYEPAPHRQALVQAGPITVVDDCYNANPASVHAALDALAAVAPAGHRVAVLGDMLELGAECARFHREVGAHAAQCGVRLVVAVGDWAGEVARGAAEGGTAQPEVVAAADASEAVARLRDRLEPGDWVLVKGSRAMGLEQVVDAIVASAQEGT